MTRVEGILRNRRYTCLKGGKKQSYYVIHHLALRKLPRGGGGGGGGGGREWRGQLAVITYGGREQ